MFIVDGHQDKRESYTVALPALRFDVMAVAESHPDILVTELALPLPPVPCRVGVDPARCGAVR
jgi:hypothetical protein